MIVTVFTDWMAGNARCVRIFSQYNLQLTEYKYENMLTRLPWDLEYLQKQKNK